MLGEHFIMFADNPSFGRNQARLQRPDFGRQTALESSLSPNDLVTFRLIFSALELGKFEKRLRSI